MDVRREIAVAGIVQGVGFRPHVFRLAQACRLAGSITNTSAGVRIEVQGPAGALDDFLARLQSEPPPLARIARVVVRDIACVPDEGFRILTSRVEPAARTFVPPDVAVCDDCLRELLDPVDRRYRYPFINCTNCGPRFTIVRDIPYDRPQTSMAAFRMCPACQAEYDDPGHRRFHAQPNACPVCGPQVTLLDRDGRRLDAEDPVRETIRRLQGGDIVAVRGLGGFHLAVDAMQADAVRRLRDRKHRVEKPFAVMVPSLTAAERIVDVDAPARALLVGWERPIVVLPRRDGGAVPEVVAPGNRFLGVFLPYTPLHHLLFAEGGFDALVMTSGNLSEEPIVIGNDEAVERLAGIADAFLVHDREILRRCDDSVVTVAAGEPRVIRRARGFVPVPVLLREPVPPVLAAGGELKNTICLADGDRAFLSQHVGDMENLESHRFFDEVVELFQRILQVRPDTIACDLHPDYFPTRWAQAQPGVRVIGVQHHHAHAVACMAENHLDGTTIAIVLDGTGYGTDGRFWGGEVLVAAGASFERAAHLAYVPMPGGEAAVREPWRMALSYLARQAGVDECVRSLPSYPSGDGVEPAQIRFVRQMIDRGVNAPLTSSCGRLFDAVAALAGLRARVTHEAQAAIALEMAAMASHDAAAYPFDLERPRGGAWVIEPRPLIQAILDDRARGVDAADIARRFHNGIAAVLARVAGLVRQDTALNRVCLSGGCFQNRTLLASLQAALRADGFEVFTHREIPCGDGGLSLGQAIVAAHLVRSS
ncbi:MAG TPA: carbamoyltransferase HypF [Vicinamibacterales bacterium]|nr:carbamoyltransferase HypF [Vicinamibacterales bacterium]